MKIYDDDNNIIGWCKKMKPKNDDVCWDCEHFDTGMTWEADSQAEAFEIVRSQHSDYVHSCRKDAKDGVLIFHRKTNTWWDQPGLGRTADIKYAHVYSADKIPPVVIKCIYDPREFIPDNIPVRVSDLPFPVQKIIGKK